jgi:hypothetical protein
MIEDIKKINPLAFIVVAAALLYMYYNYYAPGFIMAKDPSGEVKVDQTRAIALACVVSLILNWVYVQYDKCAKGSMSMGDCGSCRMDGFKF